ncbi:MAG: type II toxin-antitoxin system Phd/YefM family antitoxin [Candidatus Sungbacteria bacterium]|nr:type II toxin-antitoxin system Phd/YefM family antitoxin [Candidatus Sungbacteria bacterium]
MDFSQIKQLVKRNGDRVILVENDRPEVVVMSFEEYEKMSNGVAREPEIRHAALSVSPARESESVLADDFSSLFDEAEESKNMFQRPSPGRGAEAARGGDLSGGPFFGRRPVPPTSVGIEDVGLDDLPLESPLP